MPEKSIKIGYFALPEGVPDDFPRAFLLLDKDKKIWLEKKLGQEVSYHQFARSLARGDITLTKQGEDFVKAIKP